MAGLLYTILLCSLSAPTRSLDCAECERWCDSFAGRPPGGLILVSQHAIVPIQAVRLFQQAGKRGRQPNMTSRQKASLPLSLSLSVLSSKPWPALHCCSGWMPNLEQLRNVHSPCRNIQTPCRPAACYFHSCCTLSKGHCNLTSPLINILTTSNAVYSEGLRGT